ncbi:hypothetical protein SAMN05519103_00323 [Rhizobiales bacterium GAS113]|nr:hypothetical protein SAMN05519103_00323 [Rhizobiales bacterium GAS113]
MTCRPSDPEFRRAVVALFLVGHDTRDIAIILKTREAIVWNTLARLDHSRPVEAVAS